MNPSRPPTTGGERVKLTFWKDHPRNLPLGLMPNLKGNKDLGRKKSLSG